SYEELDNLDDALKRYAQTVELDPNHKEALFRSATSCCSQNNPQNALKMLKNRPPVPVSIN
ncbi:MAG TPA: tetratricopeptide repeat protein, partial [Myxococcales bacterium]|nr:tetratricopeptide repeat protein [Myxococcales bacterium]